MTTPLRIAYVGVLLAGIALTGIFGAVAWRRRPSREATALVVLAAGIIVWLSGTTTSVLAGDLETKVVAAKFSYFGIVTTTPAFFLLTLLYTGRDAWVDRRLVAGLAVEPVIFLGGLWSPHDLVYSSVSVTSTSLVFDAAHGPLFWIHVVYAYLLTVVATGLLLEFLYRTQYLYTRQVLALLTAVAAPWLANVLYLGEFVPFDPTPVAFAVSGAMLTWAVLEAGFVDLSPIAREAVVDHINHGMLVVDEEGRLIDVNPTCKSMLDADDGDIGRSLDEFVDDYPELVEEFVDAREKREKVMLDTPKGHRVYDVEVTPLTDYRDRLQGRLFLIQDVTDRWHREQELQRQNEQLDRFASVVSHDLRNPLNVLEGYVELARKSGDTEPLDEAVDSIDRMYQLIDDVLSLAREGRQIESREPVDLRTVAREAWANLDAPDATLTVVDDRTVQADRSRLIQALENLFLNAVEHAGPAVTVEVGAIDGLGFYVQDDGPGIPDAEHDDVLEYGYTTADEGTGLGLAIVDAIAEAHGWDLRLVTVGTGARFEFRDANVTRDDSVVLAERL